MAGIPAGLAGGMIVAVILLVCDLVTPGRSPKLLEIGTFLLFSGSSCWP